MIEADRLGGTCVNVGCVPKKVMYCASNLREELLHDATDYGLEVEGRAAVDWPALTAKRDAYVKRLNGIYEVDDLQYSIDQHRMCSVIWTGVA